MCTDCGCATCKSNEVWSDGACAAVPTAAPTTAAPTGSPTTGAPTGSPTTGRPTRTMAPTDSPTKLQIQTEIPREVRFSPNAKNEKGGVWQGIQDRINAAQSSIDVAMYSLSDATHRSALCRAVERGLKVRVVMHTTTCARCSRCKYLSKCGVDVRFVTPTMHNKLAVFDYDDLTQTPNYNCKVATGSCNWSFSSATKYDEDWIVFSGDLAPKTIRAYKQEFEWLWAYSASMRMMPPPTFLGIFLQICSSRALTLTDVSPPTTWNQSLKAGSGALNSSKMTTTRRMILHLVHARRK